MAGNKKETLYQILGVDSNVGSADIKRAYRRLVKSLHPDVEHSKHSDEDRNIATERMMRVNHAYETLMDRTKRSAYDTELGISRSSRVIVQAAAMVNEDELRERYLRRVFHPSRHAILKVMNSYQRQLRLLSQDIYDEQLVSEFERYVDSFEETLRAGSDAFAREQWPKSLDAAVQMMRYCIAQAADALEEMRRFCTNFDYDHLAMAQNLIKIAGDLSKQSLSLTKY